MIFASVVPNAITYCNFSFSIIEYSSLTPVSSSSSSPYSKLFSKIAVNNDNSNMLPTVKHTMKTRETSPE